jgi:hypothetical protein
MSLSAQVTSFRVEHPAVVFKVGPELSGIKKTKIEHCAFMRAAMFRI